jgi:phosphatidylinositol glycan class A protein
MGHCDIFLNTPLTESFGIALAEAAMLGLFCVSTNVGGVEEAVPSKLLLSASPEPKSLIDVLSLVINKIEREKHQNPQHNNIIHV